MFKWWLFDDTKKIIIVVLGMCWIVLGWVIYCKEAPTYFVAEIKQACQEPLCVGIFDSVEYSGSQTTVHFRGGATFVAKRLVSIPHESGTKIEINWEVFPFTLIAREVKR